VFADVDRDSQNLTAATIEAVLTPATRAVVCVHLGGQPCDMDPIMALANDRGLAVIEDCAQANGALYKGRSVGTFGHINAWSFCQDKIMTTGGEGGMVTTDNTALWERAWSYKDHGKTWDAVYKRTHPLGVRLVHDNFGVNGRMTEMQAVLGRIQLKRMAEWHAARAQNAQAIRNVAARFPLMRVPPVPREMVHAWYRCYLFIEPEYLAEEWTRDRIIEEIVARGVPCLHGSASEVYLERSFKEAGLAPAMRLPVAHEFGETSIAFLVHPNLTVEEIEKTCDVLAEVAAMAQAVHVSAKASAAV
ncbi:MAG: DegT/DnrJ/EryC1/StrS aminotransferase family protein, partial [Hyphomicrobium sp.]